MQRGIALLLQRILSCTKRLEEKEHKFEANLGNLAT